MAVPGSGLQRGFCQDARCSKYKYHGQNARPLRLTGSSLQWTGADTFSAVINMYFAGSSLVLLLATHALAAVPAALHQNKARQATPYAVKEPPLTTPWTDKAGTDPWPEYPRPQLERSEWKNLNGIWQYQDAQSLAALDSPPFGQPLAHEVLVPSCLESGLSGKLCQSAWAIAHTHQHTSRYPRERYLIFVVYHAVHCSPVLQRPERSSELCRGRL